jgi:hypothetical protein
MYYGWESHQVMNDTRKGKKSVADLDSLFAKNQKKEYPSEAYFMNFTSNHDENS